MIKRLFFIVAVLMFVSYFFVPVSVWAANDLGLGQACKGAAADSTYCKNQLKKGDKNPAQVLLIKIADIAAYLGGAIAVIIIVYAGLRYVVSSGNPEKTSTALKTIIYAAVGIVVIIVARTLIVFVINKVVV